MKTAWKKLFFSSPTRKKIMILDSVGLDLWKEKSENRRRNHAYVESISNRIITKQGLKENNKDNKEVKSSAYHFWSRGESFVNGVQIFKVARISS